MCPRESECSIYFLGHGVLCDEVETGMEDGKATRNGRMGQWGEPAGRGSKSVFTVSKETMLTCTCTKEEASRIGSCDALRALEPSINSANASAARG